MLMKPQTTPLSPSKYDNRKNIISEVCFHGRNYLWFVRLQAAMIASNIIEGLPSAEDCKKRFWLTIPAKSMLGINRRAATRFFHQIFAINSRTFIYPMIYPISTVFHNRLIRIGNPSWMRLCVGPCKTVAPQDSPSDHVTPCRANKRAHVSFPGISVHGVFLFSGKWSITWPTTDYDSEQPRCLFINRRIFGRRKVVFNLGEKLSLGEGKKQLFHNESIPGSNLTFEKW